MFRTGLTLNYVGPEHDLLDNYYGVLGNATVQPNGLVHEIGSFTTLDWQISYEFGKPVEITPETPATGYSKDGKSLAGEAAIAPKAEGAHNGWIRYWLAGSKITFGINNVFDTPPPFADNPSGMIRRPRTRLAVTSILSWRRSFRTASCRRQWQRPARLTGGLGREYGRDLLPTVTRHNAPNGFESSRIHLVCCPNSPAGLTRLPRGSRDRHCSHQCSIRRSRPTGCR